MVSFSPASVAFWLLLAWGGVGLVFLVEKVLWKAVREYRKTHSPRECALALVAVLGLLVYGGQKPSSQQPRSAPRNTPPAVPSLTPAQCVAGFALTEVRTNTHFSSVVPLDATLHSEWKLRGAHRDSFPISTNDLPSRWSFQLGTSTVSRVSVSSSGLVSFEVPFDSDTSLLPDPTAPNHLEPFHAPLGIAPQDKWSALASDPSLFWADATEIGSLRLTWLNALYNRNANTPISFQAELYPSGDFCYRYDFGAVQPTTFVIGAQHNGGGESFTTLPDSSSFELYWTAFGELNPDDPDFDDDGLSDYDEVHVSKTNPKSPDSDGDGIHDSDDPNPNHCDTNRDAIPDGTDSNTWLQHPLRAENAGFTNLVLTALHGMHRPVPEPRLRALATEDSAPSALLVLGGFPVPVYTGDVIPLGIPAGEFMEYELFIRGNLFTQLELSSPRPLYLDGAKAVFSGGTYTGAAGRLALPTLTLLPQSKHGTTCLHEGEDGMVFRPILHPSVWPSASSHAILDTFTLQEDTLLWLRAPDSVPGNTATGVVTLNPPWLFQGVLSATGSVHWCEGVHGTDCTACGTVHGEGNDSCSHESDCDARFALEDPCSCMTAFLRIHSDDDNNNDREDRYDFTDKPTDNDLLHLRLYGESHCCCCAWGDRFSSIRITEISSGLCLWDSNGLRIEEGDTLTDADLWVEAIGASSYISGGILSYEILDQNEEVFRSITRRFTMADVQIQADFDGNGEVTTGDAVMRWDGAGRTAPWIFAMREEPYILFLNHEGPAQEGTLQLSLTGSCTNGPLLKVGTETLSPGDTTNRAPFCVRNASTYMELHTAGITNGTATIQYSLSFDGVHSPISDTLNIQILDVEVPSYVVRTNHVDEISYDLGHISTTVEWEFMDEVLGLTITNSIGPTFTPPSGLPNGYYRLLAQISGTGERNPILQVGTLYVVPVVVEPITSEMNSVNDMEMVYNPIFVVTNSIGHFKIDVGSEAYIPNEDITWECEGVTFIGPGNIGREVDVIPNALGEYTPKINIKNFVGPTPQIKFRAVDEVTVPVSVCIVRDGDLWATTPTTASNHIAGVNSIFSQVGIKFSLLQVTTQNRENGLIIQAGINGQYHSAHDLCSEMESTGGIELYYVHEIHGGYAGIHLTSGIILSTNANECTVAHEIGHACGLPDIYDNDSMMETNVEVSGPVTKARAPNDWPCQTEENYYSPNVDIPSLLHRVLMYGYNIDSHKDISIGDIYGLFYNETEEEDQIAKRWFIGLAPIGFDNVLFRDIFHE